MTYVALSAAFLGGALLVAAIAVVRVAVVAGAGALAAVARRWWLPALVAAAVVLLLTALFDNLMIAAGLMAYASKHLSGLHIARAPLEDFAYPVAALVLLPSLWSLFGSLRLPAHTVSRLAAASRPVSWINTAFPFAAAYYLSIREVDAVLVVGTVFFLVPYNLAMYGVNDVFDYESDLANPRKGGIEGAMLDRRLHRVTLVAAIAVCVPFVIALVLMGTPAAWAALAVSLFAVAAYSVPGLRFKERPFLDSATSSTHFVSPAVVGLALADAAWTPALVALLAAFFLWGVGSHAFGAVQDIVPDREGGIGSVATVMGARWTVRFAIAAWLAAGLLMLTTPWPGPLAGLLALPYIAIAMPYRSVGDERSASANRAWRRFIWLNYASGFLVTLILISYVIERPLS